MRIFDHEKETLYECIDTTAEAFDKTIQSIASAVESLTKAAQERNHDARVSELVELLFHKFTGSDEVLLHLLIMYVHLVHHANTNTEEIQ